jgi:mono/diheme cytochrome c family protein
MKRTALMLAFSAAALFAAGCRQDMHNQPKYIPLRESEFFVDGRGARLPVEHTVARGHLNEDDYFYTGKRNGQLGNELPEGLLHEGYGMKELLARGQERYGIYCTPCHSRTGDGNGMIVQRGLKRPPSYHEARLKQQPLSYFYDVMTNGFGAMLNYSAQINPQDRWAIAAYVRALQLSQDARMSDVPESERAKLGVAPQAHQGTTVEPAASPASRQKGGPQ